MNGFIKNIIEQTEQNTYFRKVIHTGKKSQLVIMSIPPQEDVGEEVHPHTEQTLFFHSGQGQAILDGVTHEVQSGDAVIVHPGVKHNFINTGSTPLQIYTLYAPANHIDGRIHKTKEEAEADQEDEDFGHNHQG